MNPAPSPIPEVSGESAAPAPQEAARALMGLGELLARIRMTWIREAQGRPVDQALAPLMEELGRLEDGIAPVAPKPGRLEGRTALERRMAIRLMAALAHQRLVEGDPRVLLGELASLAAPGPAGSPEWIAALRLAGECCRLGLFRADDGSLSTTQVELGADLLETIVGKDTVWEPDPAGVDWRIKREQPAPPSETGRDGRVPDPRAIAARLAQRVVGLESIVRPFACRMTRHLARRALARQGADTDLPNECLLFIGCSGSGKTWLAESAGRLLGLPFASSAATDMTAEGYSGLSVDDAVRPLVPAGPGGICFVDEWDKKAACNARDDRDVGGRAVQQAMLRMMEGTVVQVGGRRSSGAGQPYDTRGTLFVFAGAFDGLAPLLARGGQRGTGLGFGAAGAPVGDALHEALLAYGMIPEFLNRLTGIFVFPEPTLDALYRILMDPVRGILKAQNRVLAAVGSELQIEGAAAAMLAARAFQSRTYSRGLRRMIDRIADQAMLDGRHGEVVVTPDLVMELFAGNPAVGDAA